MDYKYATTYSDRSRIDKLNNLTNPYTFWKDVDKFTKNLVSPIVINSWKHLANIRYNELLEVNGLTKEEVDCEIRKITTKDLSLVCIEKMIKNARIEQKILNKLMDDLYKKLNELGIDLEVSTNVENVNCLDEAINCYIHYGEFSLEKLMYEIKKQLL